MTFIMSHRRLISAAVALASVSPLGGVHGLALRLNSWNNQEDSSESNQQDSPEWRQGTMGVRARLRKPRTRKPAVVTPVSKNLGKVMTIINRNKWIRENSSDGDSSESCSEEEPTSILARRFPTVNIDNLDEFALTELRESAKKPPAKMLRGKAPLACDVSVKESRDKKVKELLGAAVKIVAGRIRGKDVVGKEATVTALVKDNYVEGGEEEHTLFAMLEWNVNICLNGETFAGKATAWVELFSKDTNSNDFADLEMLEKVRVAGKKSCFPKRVWFADQEEGGKLKSTEKFLRGAYAA